MFVGAYAFCTIFFSDDGRRLATEMKALEFVHITHTGGSAVEKAAHHAGVNWGVCHFEKDKSAGCSTPDFDGGETKGRNGKSLYINRNIWHTAPKFMEGVIPDEQNPYHDKDLFAIVRNPYARIISEYYCPYNGYVGKERETSNVLNSWIVATLTEIKRERDIFLKELESGTKLIDLEMADSFSQKHLEPQFEYVYGDDGKRVIQNVLHFEDLPTHFKSLMTKYNYDHIILPPTDTGEHDGVLTIRDLYPETLALINDFFGADFDAFGYAIVRDFEGDRPYDKVAKTKPCKTYKIGDTGCERDGYSAANGYRAPVAHEAPIGIAHSTTFLLGIFSDLTEQGANFRNLARQTYLNTDDPSICSWPEFVRQKTDQMVAPCRVPYVFVIGGDPSRPEEHHDKEPLAIKRALVEGTHNDEPDVVFLNIADNDNYGKANAYLKWAANFGAGLDVDFAAKVSYDTVVDIPLLIDFIELDLPAAPYNRRMYGGGIWGYFWEGGYYATDPFYFVSLDLAAYVAYNRIDWNRDAALDVGRMIFKHPKPIKFINMNPRIIWHEGRNTTEAWTDAWENRMGELPIAKPSVQNDLICQEFKDQGLM